MNLYHGSLEIVMKPEIRVPNRTLETMANAFMPQLQVNRQRHGLVEKSKKHNRTLAMSILTNSFPIQQLCSIAYHFQHPPRNGLIL